MKHLMRQSTTINSLPPPAATLSVSAINSKIKDLALKGLYDQVLTFYKDQLHPSGLHACTSILPSIIKACSSSSTPHSHHSHLGLQLHCIALKTASDSDPVVSNSLISMYAKSSNTPSALRLFNTMLHRDTISWNSIINCYIQNGYCIEALKMLKPMHECGFSPKPELIASVLSLCSRSGGSTLLVLGTAIHALVIVDDRIPKDSVVLSTALVDLHMRCNNLSTAFRVFDSMRVRNEVSWTAMVWGCANNENYEMAIHCFRAMQVEGIEPNRVTLMAILPACIELGCGKHEKQIHGYAIRRGFDSECRFSAALLHMYCERGAALQLHYAKLIFERAMEKDVVMWSSIIESCSRSGDGVEAMKLFRRMRVEGVEPNSVTLLPIIHACTSLCLLSLGCGVHGYVLKSGLSWNVFIGNSLINMYSKCGWLAGSLQIFREMPVKDSVSWSVLISGYGVHGIGEEALQLFCEMQERGMEPDAITFLAVLSACNHAGLVEEGQRLFNNAMKDDAMTLNVEHYACFIDLLGKSGKLEDACEVVRVMPMKPSLKIWSSLVSACKMHGRLEVAEMLAHRLIKLEPENVANYTLLSMVYAEVGNWFSVEKVHRVMRAGRLKKSCGFSQIELENGSS